MILLLNLIPWLILVLGFFLFYRASKIETQPKRRNRMLTVAVATVLAIFVYNAAQPSYVPKGEARTTLELPVIDTAAPEIPVQNRLLVAKPEAEQEAKFKEEFDWRKQVKENKEEVDNSDK